MRPPLDTRVSHHLSLQDDEPPGAAGLRALVVGEVLWDLFPDSVRLGGAPLNFAVHLARLGHAPLLVSAVGTDRLGDDARAAIARLGLDTTALQSTARFGTGTARVRLEPDEQTSFAIERPAAYDAIELSDNDFERFAGTNPGWLYFGTLFPSRPEARRILSRLLDRLPGAKRVYDVNLRPGFEAPELVEQLLQHADAVKLNERELQFVHEHLRLPLDPEAFCRAGADRYGWMAACVTFGSRGCAVLAGGDYATAPGVPITAGDPVGAGDAFAAAFVHGVASGWPAARVASIANRIGAHVAATPGAIPSATR